MSQYMKAWVAVAGAAVTAAIGIFPPDSKTWQTLQIVAAVITAIGVYLVPNTPQQPTSAPRTVDYSEKPGQ